MENTDLKWIKKHYGEKFSHLCRSLFPTILETEGLLTKLLSEHFPPSRELYNDLILNDLTLKFKNYVHNLTETKENKKETKLTPEELLDKAGYILYPECKSERDIQSFRHYYHRGSPTPVYQGGSPARYEGEELCTFNGGRLRSNRVWFAVKKNVDEIRREDFKYPRREDDYGVSVLSIQFTHAQPSILSIKNRYNHTVYNPDTTYSNNLDNIIEGLTQAFVNTYGINLIGNNSNSLEIPGYVQTRDGKFYKYNKEINNVYYCPNNIIIQDGEVKHFDKDKCIVFDYFILDLEKKQIINYNNLVQRNDAPDSFPKSVGKIKSIKRIPSNDGLTILITPENSESVEITLNKHNEIISYVNPNVVNVGDNFLHYNNSLTNIELPNAKQIGNFFLDRNKSLTSIELPSVEKIGNYFLTNSELLTNIELPNAKQIGNYFLDRNKSLTSIELPSAEKIGSNFLGINQLITSVELPNVRWIGSGFLSGNKSLYSIQLPKVEKINDFFLNFNTCLTNIELPNIISIGCYFLHNNKSLKSIEFPKVEKIGSEFLYSNNSLINLSLPSAKQISSQFLWTNKTLINVNLPNIEKIADYFLPVNNSLKSLELPNVEKIGNSFLYGNQSLTNLELPKVKQIGNEFLRYNNSLTKLELPSAEKIGYSFLSNNTLISEVKTANSVKILNENASEHF